jgi:hypothetical protein
MWRAVSLVATLKLVRSILRMAHDGARHNHGRRRLLSARTMQRSPAFVKNIERPRLDDSAGLCVSYGTRDCSRRGSDANQYPPNPAEMDDRPVRGGLLRRS